MDDLLNIQLPQGPHEEKLNDNRKQISDEYARLFEEREGTTLLRCPKTVDGEQCNGFLIHWFTESGNRKNEYRKNLDLLRDMLHVQCLLCDHEFTVCPHDGCKQVATWTSYLIRHFYSRHNDGNYIDDAVRKQVIEDLREGVEEFENEEYDDTSRMTALTPETVPSTGRIIKNVKNISFPVAMKLFISEELVRVSERYGMRRVPCRARKPENYPDVSIQEVKHVLDEALQLRASSTNDMSMNDDYFSTDLNDIPDEMIPIGGHIIQLFRSMKQRMSDDTYLGFISRVTRTGYQDPNSPIFERASRITAMERASLQTWGRVYPPVDHAPFSSLRQMEILMLFLQGKIRKARIQELANVFQPGKEYFSMNNELFSIQIIDGSRRIHNVRTGEVIIIFQDRDMQVPQESSIDDFHMAKAMEKLLSSALVLPVRYVSCHVTNTPEYSEINEHICHSELERLRKRNAEESNDIREQRNEGLEVQMRELDDDDDDDDDDVDEAEHENDNEGLQSSEDFFNALNSAMKSSNDYEESSDTFPWITVKENLKRLFESEDMCSGLLFEPCNNLCVTEFVDSRRFRTIQRQDDNCLFLACSVFVDGFRKKGRTQGSAKGVYLGLLNYNRSESRDINKIMVLSMTTKSVSLNRILELVTSEIVELQNGFIAYYAPCQKEMKMRLYLGAVILDGAEMWRATGCGGGSSSRYCARCHTRRGDEGEHDIVTICNEMNRRSHDETKRLAQIAARMAHGPSFSTRDRSEFYRETGVHKESLSLPFYHNNTCHALNFDTFKHTIEDRMHILFSNGIVPVIINVICKHLSPRYGSEETLAREWKKWTPSWSSIHARRYKSEQLWDSQDWMHALLGWFPVVLLDRIPSDFSSFRQILLRLIQFVSLVYRSTICDEEIGLAAAYYHDMVSEIKNRLDPTAQNEIFRKNKCHQAIELLFILYEMGSLDTQTFEKKHQEGKNGYVRRGYRYGDHGDRLVLELMRMLHCLRMYYGKEQDDDDDDEKRLRLFDDVFISPKAMETFECNALQSPVEVSEKITLSNCVQITMSNVWKGKWKIREAGRISTSRIRNGEIIRYGPLDYASVREIYLVRGEQRTNSLKYEVVLKCWKWETEFQQLCTLPRVKLTRNVIYLTVSEVGRGLFFINSETNEIVANPFQPP